MPLLDHFSLLAPFYERFIPFREPEKILQYAALPVDGILLDAGGGTGRVAKALKSYVRATIVADLSLGMLHQIGSQTRISAVNSQSEYLPFNSRSFERVIMIDALHHVIHQQQTADELWRVLKPGGRLVIVEPDLRQLAVKLVAVGEKMALMRSHFLDMDEITVLFRDPCAKVKTSQAGFNAYIIVERQAD